MTRISYQQKMGDLPDAEIVIPGKRRKRKKGEPFTKEWQLHAACAKLCYQRERNDLGFRFFSPGAEHARTPQRAAIAKMMSQNRAGVPDLWMIYAPDGVMPKIWAVEFKLPGKHLTPEQRDWLEWLPSARIGTFICRRVDEFRAILGSF